MAHPSKEYPFVCTNCGSKPTPEQVVDNHGDCKVCGDSIVAHTIDVAEYILDAALRPPTEKGWP